MGPNAGAGFALMIIPIILFAIMGLAATIITVFAFCRIFSKAGYSWALGLIALIPIGNVIMLLVLAFSDWPIAKELRALKQSHSSGI